jgi:hypothetical protein
MPWVYESWSGRLYDPKGRAVTTTRSTSYSVAGIFRRGKDLNAENYPTAETVPFAGPIPAGFYAIGHAYHHHRLGPMTMDLAPWGHSRPDMRIHGDNVHSNHPSRDASYRSRYS